MARTNLLQNNLPDGQSNWQLEQIEHRIDRKHMDVHQCGLVDEQSENQ
jgi:hypothetical protein